MPLTGYNLHMCIATFGRNHTQLLDHVGIFFTEDYMQKSVIVIKINDVIDDDGGDGDTCR